MREYYLEYGEMQDLKHAVSIGNKLMQQQILHEVEMRNYRLRIAQDHMIMNHKYFNNTEG